MNDYTPVIGLEIHLQLKTKSKMFSAAPNQQWQAQPNSMVNPVELGLPGALPVPNETAITWTQRFGLALGCSLNKISKFDRKNYFYPDLPKGYQISQYDQPFCYEGNLEITESVDKPKNIRIRRIHLEEDTGKSHHKNGSTYLDFNKAGTPLVEIVTEPDFANAEETSEFAKIIQHVARILDISDADMEKGHLRLEANISVKKPGEIELPNYRVEVKNINSFKFLRDAINHEIQRQKQMHEEGKIIPQQTRGWNELKGITVVQRDKEDAHDYRYFPEPDIPPFVFTDDEINQLRGGIPLMPWDIKKDLQSGGIREDFAHIIAYDQQKMSWWGTHNGDLSDKNKIASIIVNAKETEEVIQKINDLKAASTRQMLSDTELERLIQKVLTENPKAVQDIKDGKENAKKFLVGQVMKASKGSADPSSAQQILDTLTQ
ncbi:Asp-tRNA(Asn)/Glu-tRNA(Gln) amidotransferase subunit GatB [candidate division WWE3 bacterium]|nr:Asp-tRNA(Asn)/Glu-tRNA(Gln) amidotransferase subunit GatB [candidate division WWE3 bacterium]